MQHADPKRAIGAWAVVVGQKPRRTAAMAQTGRLEAGKLIETSGQQNSTCKDLGPDRHHRPVRQADLAARVFSDQSDRLD